MSIIQDKLGNEFLRNGGMDPNFAPGMLMFSHLPPVTSFTRLASQSVMGELPQEMILKKERDSPPDHQGTNAANTGGFLHSMGIKQERLSELDYRMPLYGGGGGVGVNCAGGGAGKSGTDLPEVSFVNHHQNHQNMLLHDLSLSNVRSLGEAVRSCFILMSNHCSKCHLRFVFTFRCLEDNVKSQKSPQGEGGGGAMETGKEAKFEGNVTTLQRFSPFGFIVNFI